MRIGVDREAMGKLAFGEGVYTVSCDHPVWAGDQYRADLDCSQNQEEAKALLKEVFGEEIPTFELFVSDISEGAIQVAEVYQAQMKEIGVNVELAMAPADGYWSDTWMKEPFFMTSWSQRPADQVLNEAYQSEAPWNESYFKNPKFDEALSKARQELDFEKRKELYGDTQRILWEEGGTLIPFHQNDLRIMSSAISGIPEVPMYSIRFQDIVKAE
jgi:peptide/nickel transport system substrate-binding protein